MEHARDLFGQVEKRQAKSDKSDLCTDSEVSEDGKQSSEENDVQRRGDYGQENGISNFERTPNLRTLKKVGNCPQ